MVRLGAVYGNAGSRLSAAAGSHSILLKNSAALTVGAVAAAALGFVYWWVAAYSFPPVAVGNASAMLSLMGLVALTGEAGLGTLLAGEIVRHPGREGGLIAAAALAVLGFSLALGGVWLALCEFTWGTLGGDNASLSAGWWFVAGCGLTGFSFIIDQAFAGMLKGSARMLRQLLFSTSKLILIVAVVRLASSATAIVSTWIVGQFVSLALIEWRARQQGWTLIHRPDFRLLGALRRKAVHHYMLDLGIQAPGTALPYLVTVLLSPKSNAAFSAIWMVVAVATVAPAALATMLFPVVQARPDQYRDKIAFSLAISLLFATAFGCVIFSFSAHILALFNPVYATIAGSSLRFVGFGLIGSVIKFHVCAAARLHNRMRQAALWIALGGLFELSCLAAGSRIDGLEGLTAGWVGAVSIEGAALLALISRWSGHVVANDGEPLPSLSGEVAENQRLSSHAD